MPLTPVTSTKLRLLSMLSVLRASVSLLLTMAGCVAVLFAPVIWFMASTRLLQDRAFAAVILLNIMVFWVHIVACSVRDFKALHKRGRPRSPNALWYVEIPTEREPFAAELVQFVEGHFSKQLQSPVRICLSLTPYIEYKRSWRAAPRSTQLAIGLFPLAVLSIPELLSLILQEGVSYFRPITPVHRCFGDLCRQANWLQAALPPHEGWFSITRWFIERTAAILKPFPCQTEVWSVQCARREFDMTTMAEAAARKLKATGIFADYMKLYTSVTESGAMPPYTEGLARQCRLIFNVPEQPAFTAFRNMWVYERQLVTSVFGPDYARNLSLASWDDLSPHWVRKWRHYAAVMRPLLERSRISDLPELMDNWRQLLNNFCTLYNVHPVRTPDWQRGDVLQRLAASFVIALIDAGWESSAVLGQEAAVSKDGRRIEPFTLIRRLGDGALTRADFARLCHDAGIAELPLAVAASPEHA